MQYPKFFPVSLGVGLLCAPMCVWAQYKEIDALASNIASQISAAPGKTVAVVDFTDLQGNDTELGRFLAEELSIAMMREGKVPMIDRTHLKPLLQEHKLDATGITDQATRTKLEIAGVRVLVTGTITPFGDSIRCAAKALDLGTAEIEAAATAEIPRTKTIEELLSRSVSSRTAEPSSTAVGTAESHRGGTRAAAQDSQSGAIFAASPTARLGDLVFTTNGCKIRSESVVCALRILNNGEARMLGIFLGRIIDQDGKEFPATGGQFGAEKSYSSIGGRYVHNTIATGVPMSLTVDFGPVSAISSITMLELGIQEKGRRPRVELRNIPIEK